MGTWRNRDSPPLNFREQAEVYRLQVWLHADKVCDMCGFYNPVEMYGGYGVQPCEECREEQKRARNAHWPVSAKPAPDGPLVRARR